MRKEAKEKARGIISVIRAISVYGIGAGAAVSVFFAGMLTVVEVAIGVTTYLNDGSFFGTRQWSIMISLWVIVILSLVVYFVLTKKCGSLLTEVINEDVDNPDVTDETDDADDGSSKVPPLWMLAALTLLCAVFFAWLFVMGCFCYAAGEMDAAGFSVAEVAVIEALVAVVMSVMLFALI